MVHDRDPAAAEHGRNLDVALGGELGHDGRSGRGAARPRHRTEALPSRAELEPCSCQRTRAGRPAASGVPDRPSSGGVGELALFPGAELGDGAGPGLPGGFLRRLERGDGADGLPDLGDVPLAVGTGSRWASRRASVGASSARSRYSVTSSTNSWQVISAVATGGRPLSLEVRLERLADP